jgi:formylmethanofuran dehydrogenase subunit E
MACSFSKELIDAVVSFHGHSCPGLAIGIRAAEYALQELDNVSLADLVCVTETDMCGVDGIQFLTKCTFGKGNLIHRDYGKAAFSFFDRSNGKAFRLVLRLDAKGEKGVEASKLMRKKESGALTEEEVENLSSSRFDLMRRLMEQPLQKLFDLQPLDTPPPRRARVLESIVCEHCMEDTMESRTRRFAGETLCVPCYEKVEQKI